MAPGGAQEIRRSAALSEPKGRFISLNPLCLVSGPPSFAMWFQSAGSKGTTCENSWSVDAALLYLATGASRGARLGALRSSMWNSAPRRGGRGGGEEKLDLQFYPGLPALESCLHGFVLLQGFDFPVFMKQLAKASRRLARRRQSGRSGILHNPRSGSFPSNVMKITRFVSIVHQ